jgi:predicted deacetylase
MLTFCIRDDDTGFFTTPDQLERAYGEIWSHGPVSLAVVPFQKGVRTKGIPPAFRETGEVYPLEHNSELVRYLRRRIRQGRIEVMLHGYHHEDFGRGPEFVAAPDLAGKARKGKEYLEGLLETRVRVFIPPHNTISRRGLKAVAAAGLHLGMLAGLRLAWPLSSGLSWRNWWRVKRFTRRTGWSYPWVVDQGDHREVMAHAVTPHSELSRLQAEMAEAVRCQGVFCLAAHYWEFDVPHALVGGVSVREQMSRMVETARSFPEMRWVSLGEVLSSGKPETHG